MNHHHCEALLLDYAAGTLTPAQDMIIAAYLTLSPEARRFVTACEEIGGAMITGDCEPSDLSPGCLESLLAKIDCLENLCEEKPDFAPDFSACEVECCAPIPQSIARLFPPQNRLKWKRAFGGIEWIQCRIVDDTASMRMIRADPGFVMPHYTHKGLEITLVLDGAIENEHGRYVRGDLFIVEEGASHHHIADYKEGCLYFSVQSGRLGLTGKLSRLLGRFF